MIGQISARTSSEPVRSQLRTRYRNGIWLLADWSMADGEDIVCGRAQWVLVVASVDECWQWHLRVSLMTAGMARVTSYDCRTQRVTWALDLFTNDFFLSVFSVVDVFLRLLFDVKYCAFLFGLVNCETVQHTSSLLLWRLLASGFASSVSLFYADDDYR